MQKDIGFYFTLSFRSLMKLPVIGLCLERLFFYIKLQTSS